MNYCRSKFYVTTYSTLIVAISLLYGCQYKQEDLADKSLNSAECQTCLDEIVINSSFPFQINKNKVKVRIDEESNDLVKMKIYEDSEAKTTLGWLVYRPKERKLADISNYLDSLPLKVDQHWLDKYERCKTIWRNKQAKKNQIALNH